MNNRNYFFLVFVLTIAITRLFLLSSDIASPTVWGLRLHHYMYGVVLLVASIWVYRTTLSAVGLGLFVDELPQLVRNDFNTWYDYYSPINMGLVFVLVVIVYLGTQLILIKSKNSS